jgi:dTDP-4-amino-4,6-dideoxygalactose transaminase
MKQRDTYLTFGAPDFSDSEIAAVTRVLRSGWVGQGMETIAFEKELAAIVGARHVIAVNSCTSALFLSMKALGIGSGDEVIVPSLTWCSTANAVLYLGATPVFCDVEADTLSASPLTIKSALTEKTKAVVYVHYGGLAADMAALRTMLPPTVAIIEDAAHALGATYPNGDPVGSSGNLTCFSFYANKNLSTGDGGAIALNDPALAERLRLISNQGLQSDAWKRFTHPLSAPISNIIELGFKMNFIDLLAAIGRVQLKRQDEFQARRVQLAQRYKNGLAAANRGIRWQKHISEVHHAHHLFVIRLPVADMKISRNELLLKLRNRNIGVSVHYAPLHTMALYQPYVRCNLPTTEDLMADILTLPFGVSITDDDADYVVSELLVCLDNS